MFQQPTVLAPFAPDIESWEAFIQRFEVYMQTLSLPEITEVKKRAFFLNACGQEMFSTARALVAPSVVYEVPWKDLLDKLSDHYAPAPSRIARRFAFHQRLQGEQETIGHYITALRAAALECYFASSEESLLDQLVCGVRDLQLQKRLLAKKTLSLSEALDMARAAEMSSSAAAEIQRQYVASSQQTVIEATHLLSQEVPPPSPEQPTGQLGTVGLSKRAGMCQQGADSCCNQHNPTVNVTRGMRAVEQPRRQGALPAAGPAMVRKQWRQQAVRCEGCGGPHARKNCKFITAICNRCGRRGHLERVCHSIPGLGFAQQPPSWPRGRKTQNWGNNCCCGIRMEEPLLESEEVYLASGGVHNKIHVMVLIEGEPLSMEIDTGSSRSLVSWQTLKRVVPKFPKRRLKPCNIILRDYQGNTIPVLGVATLGVKKGEFSGQLDVVVVANSLPSLLGLDWFGPLGLSISGVHVTNSRPAAELRAWERPRRPWSWGARGFCRSLSAPYDFQPGWVGRALGDRKKVGEPQGLGRRTHYYKTPTLFPSGPKQVWQWRPQMGEDQFTQGMLDQLRGCPATGPRLSPSPPVSNGDGLAESPLAPGAVKPEPSMPTAVEVEPSVPLIIEAPEQEPPGLQEQGAFGPSVEPPVPLPSAPMPLIAPEMSPEVKHQTGGNQPIQGMQTGPLVTPVATSQEPRRSGRIHKRPAYLDDDVCACQVGRGVMSWPGQGPLRQTPVEEG